MGVPVRYVAIDIETTGLDPETCQILELGAVIDDLVSPIESLPRFSIIVKYEIYTGQAGALVMNRDLLLAQGCYRSELAGRFRAWLLRNDYTEQEILAAARTSLPSTLASSNECLTSPAGTVA
jgi:oligoribonuclease (3'-5' exoribonuclease)